MSYEVQGRVYNISETQKISDKFQKREFVLELENEFKDTTYKDYVKFQLTNDKCTLIDGISVNDVAKVSFNLKGSMYEKEGKTMFFTNLNAWRIEKLSGEQGTTFEETAKKVADAIDANDGLPF